MDLLDSILKGMEKPPSVKKPVIKDKEKREKFEKIQRERQEAARKNKEMINKFRNDITLRIKKFVNTPESDVSVATKLELEPMTQIYRTIVREICEEHEDEIVVHSFGTEELDRHCVIWKRGYEPCDDEIRAMKAGVEYKPKKDDDDDDVEPTDDGVADSKTSDGKDKFWSKYERIIGENASGIESAQIAMPASKYGCVPVANKKDQRSIEQMIDDIRKNKRQKTSDVQQSTEG